MCGIVGIIAKNKTGLFKPHIGAIKQLLFANQLRGTDGTGVFYYTTKGTKALKQPTPATSFILSEKFDREMEVVLKESKYIIGHNRAATKGKQVWADTHPFQKKHITLIHNGTLFQHDELGTKAAVDSHAICIHMAEHGYAETLKTIRGAFALVWADDDEGTLNICRNNDRPLFLLESNTTWLISSEAELGQWIGARTNNPIHKVIPIVAGIKYTFHLEDTSKYEEEKVEFYTFKYTHPPYNEDYCGYGGGHNYTEQAALPAPGISTPHTAAALFKSIPMMRPTGTVIKFRPLKVGKDKDALLFDIEKQKYYVFCRPVVDEKGVSIRVYGHMDSLKEWKEEELLEGTIILATRREKSIIYNVAGVRVPKIADTSQIKCKWCEGTITIGELKDSTKSGDGFLCSQCANDVKQYGWDMT